MCFFSFLPQALVLIFRHEELDCVLRFINKLPSNTGTGNIQCSNYGDHGRPFAPGGAAKRGVGGAHQ